MIKGLLFLFSNSALVGYRLRDGVRSSLNMKFCTSSKSCLYGALCLLNFTPECFRIARHSRMRSLQTKWSMYSSPRVLLVWTPSTIQTAENRPTWWIRTRIDRGMHGVWCVDRFMSHCWLGCLWFNDSVVFMTWSFVFVAMCLVSQGGGRAESGRRCSSSLKGSRVSII
jgi:hypothetical protein